MSITLTDHQSAAVKTAANWYADADRNRHVFENCRYEPFPDGKRQKTMLNEGQSFFFGGYAGTGKAQPLTAIIQTPSGPVRMGDIRVGDVVFGADGNPTTILGVFPQGVKPVYRVTFRDGTSTTCCDAHLWNVSSPKEAGQGKVHTLPLSKIRETGVRFPSGNLRYKIPLCAGVDYGWDSPFLDPYLVGALLGDGYLHGHTPQITISDDEPEMLDLVRARLPDNVSADSYGVGAGCRQYRLVHSEAVHDNPLKQCLLSLGIAVHGKDKHIPLRYMRAPLEDRIELLRGLMDTDGSVRGNRTSFSSSTKRLAQDVCGLVRSLGGVAILKEYTRKANGKSELNVNVKTQFNPFRLSRKAGKWTPSTKNPPSKYIADVAYIGEEEQQCIQVEALDGLYLTDDFIVTHNTTVMPSVLDMIGIDPDAVAFVAPTGKASKIMGQKLRDFGIRAVPTTIHKLIYLPKPERAATIQSRLTGLQENIIQVKIAGGGLVPYADRNGEYDLTFEEAELKVKELMFDLSRAMDSSDGPTFSLKPLSSFPEQVKLIIVDEGSMVGLDIARDLATFGRPILAFGDHGQLPPVGDVYGFDCEHPDAMLTEVHRQAKDNPIIHLATLARQGRDLKVGDYGNGVQVVKRQNDNVTLNMEREAMVLCGTHVKRWNLTKAIRGALGYTTSGPCDDEQLLITRNSKVSPELVNGTFVRCKTEIGDLQKGVATLDLTVVDEEDNNRSYEVKAAQAVFEEHMMRKRNAYSASPQAAFKAKTNNEHIDFGHVLTVHKSQGSQWDEVVVHDESAVFRDASSRWLYTGITRAAKQLTVVV